MAAGLTDHQWTMRELLSSPIPLPPWVAPKRRGDRPSDFRPPSRSPYDHGSLWCYRPLSGRCFMFYYLTLATGSRIMPREGHGRTIVGGPGCSPTGAAQPREVSERLVGEPSACVDTTSGRAVPRPAD